VYPAFTMKLLSNPQPDAQEQAKKLLEASAAYNGGRGGSVSGDVAANAGQGAEKRGPANDGPLLGESYARNRGAERGRVQLRP
jgi:hypothetical protein